MELTLNSKVQTIMNDYENNKIISCHFGSIDNLIKCQILSNLLSEVTIPNTKSFKMEYYYPFFEFFVNTINELCLDHEVKAYFKVNIQHNLFISLTKLNKGQKLLNKLTHFITLSMSKENAMHYITEAARYGTLLTFLFWLTKTNKTLEGLDRYDQEIIFIHAVANSDDRLFKYILNKMLKIDKLFFQKNSTTINSMISSISYSCVPDKYILKRLKLLSEYISLIPYFNVAISYLSPNHSKVIYTLHKYYYKQPHDFLNIVNIASAVCNNFSYDSYYKQKEILKTENEKVLFYIIMALKFQIVAEDMIPNLQLFEKVIIDNKDEIVGLIYWNNIFSMMDYDVIKLIIKILYKTNAINEFADKSFSKNILFFTRFNPIEEHIIDKSLYLSVNLFLHKLRLKIRRVEKNKIIEKKVKMFNLLNEIENFAPKKNITILSKGSLSYQYQKQKFNNIPPRHLLPNEISIYNDFLLREKADGILINNLPLGIYPENEIIYNYQVKAEYIEDLDLYLVFDIDIPNTTIIDRYNILRKAHSYTQNTNLQTLTNLDEFIELMIKERNILTKFMKENNKPIKWFPKFAVHYNNSNVIHEDIINNSNIIHEQIINNIIINPNKILTELEYYECDGLIITPLDGGREIKVKPKNLMSIDLLYNNKWLDREGNDWSNIINHTNNVKNGKIYRCYPQISESNELSFNVGPLRYDKKKPNNFMVVDNIINCINHNWSQDIVSLKNVYYETNNKIQSINLINTFKQQNKLLIEHLELIKPSVNKSWLDLGCGKGKLIPLIQKYNPKNYLGLDIDVRQLIRALEYHNTGHNTYIFNPCNLASDWEVNAVKWYNIFSKQTYDYVVANFSLMHFFTDHFWTQLNKLVHSGTKFIFNLVNDKPINHFWYESQSFLRVEEKNVVYKFEWVHNDIKVEPLITEEMLNETLKKYGWKSIVRKDNRNSKYELLNFYSWWIIEKI